MKPEIVSAQEWTAAWQQMLVKEKEVLHARATRSQPSAGACRGRRSRKNTCSTDRTAK